MDEHITPANQLGAANGTPDDGSMAKMVCMIKRKPGMSRQAFIEYYETPHAVLAAKHLPMLAGYRRSYMIPNSTFYAGHIANVAEPPRIDVMTEMWFRTPAALAELSAVTADPVIGDLFAKDEVNLFDRSSIQMFMVDECVTPTSDLQRPARAKGYLSRRERSFISTAVKSLFSTGPLQAACRCVPLETE